MSQQVVAHTTLGKAFLRRWSKM